MTAFKNDTGLKITIDIGIKSDEINFAKFYVEKPDKNKTTWEAIAETDTTNIYYMTKSGDLDLAGKYRIQPYIETSTGFKGRGEIIILYVKDII